MKQVGSVLGFLLFLTPSLIHAQDVNADADLYADTLTVSQPLTQYAAAEEAYARYFLMKNDPSSDKDALYETLLESFMDYVKSLDGLNDEQTDNVKIKIRQLRPELEEAGIYYNQNGVNNKAYKYLECYLNIPHLPIFEGEKFEKNDNYAAYVFNVAAESYNARELETAAYYLLEYIELGEKRFQQTCYLFLALTYDRMERFDEELTVLDEGIMNYPNDLDMIVQAIDLSLRRNNKKKAEEMLAKAITLAPNDPRLLLTKASIAVQNGRYTEALPVYQAFYKQDSTNVVITKELAFCHYNIAGEYINQSNSATDATQFQTLRNAAMTHFNQAIALLQPLSKSQEVIQNDQRVINALADALTQVGRGDDATAVKQSQQTPSMLPASSKKGGSETTPNFNEWYKPKLDEVLADWEKRGEFEPAEEYTKRVNPEARRALGSQTRTRLEAEYIQEFSGNYNLDDLTLKIYDPDHQTYRIQTKQGDLYLKIPLANNEAQKFKESWNGVKIVSPQFKVDKSGQLLLATAQFVTPYGQAYKYDVNEPLEYGKIKIARPVWNDDDLMNDLASNDTPQQRPAARTTTDEPIVVGESTIDVNIPQSKEVNGNTFVLIINNEKYKNVDDVPYAHRDGDSFKNYCRKTLGVPEENIVHAPDATGNEMTVAIDRIKQFESAYRGMKLLVYYSGHGVPDPSTNETYLLPSDGSPHNISTGYKLSRFYSELTANNPGSVTVFLDACFSGAKRDGKSMDTAARGVIVKPRDETPVSNMVVFSASTGSETAYPYPNQRHGLFTYFLLRKLQEDKGKTTYKKLFDYVQTNVKQNSIRLNGKIQTPTVQSLLPASQWEGWRLDK